MRSAIAFALVVIASVILPTNGAAQNMFLERGDSGFGIAAGLGSGDGWSSLGIGIGYSILGIGELGLAVSRVSTDVDLDATAITPSLSVAVLKQTEDIPMSIELGISYEHDAFSSDLLDAYGLDMSAEGYSLGSSFYSRLRASESVHVIPSLSVGYTHVNLKVEDGFGDSLSEDDSSTWFGFGMAIAFTLSDRQVIYISPHLSTSEGETSIGASLGFVLPTNRRL